jgi:hypothetical protein
MTGTATSQRTCCACGTAMIDGAFVCPNCKQAFCIACNTPITVGPKTARCNENRCTLYAKPFCDNCVVVDIPNQQDDLGRRPSNDVHRWIWPMFYVAEQRWKRKEFLMRVALCGGFVFALVLTVGVMWMSMTGSTGRPELTGTWEEVIGTWLFLCVSYWLALRPPKIQLRDCCPACNRPMAQGVPLIDRPYRKVPITEIYRWEARLTQYEKGFISS